MKLTAWCTTAWRMGVDGFAALAEGRAAAVNMRDGKITNPAVAEAFGDL